jgi:uncharacterized protein (DUF433 family)/transposase
VGDVISLLERPVYRFAEADRLLRVNRGTVKRWVNGYTRNGSTYPPVVREKPTDSPWVTWGEFVEARLLSEYRTSIPMIKLRPLVDRLREQFGQRYPLSYARPYLLPEGRELLLEAQLDSGIDSEFWIVVSTGQTAIMTATGRRFTEAAVFPDREGAARSIRADAGTPAVLLDPLRSQGQPSIRGVPAESIAELVSAGEPVEYVAATYDFTVEEVEQAVSYEASRVRAS